MVAPIVYFDVMPHFDVCRDILFRLISKGDPNGIALAERAVDEYVKATPLGAQTSGLRLLQEDMLACRNAVVGDQREFAKNLSDYIKMKLRGED